MKKIFKILGITLLVIIAILFIAPFIFKGKIIDVANEQLDKNLNAKASFSDISISFFRDIPNLSIRLKELCIFGIDEFEEDTLAYIQAFDISVNIPSAIKMENIEIKRISIIKPFINGIVLADGTANWDITPESEEEPEEVEEDTTSSEFNTNIALKLFEITEARIYYSDYSSNMFATMDNFGFTLRGDLSQDFSVITINSETEKLNFSMDGIKYLNNVLLGLHFDIDANLKESIYTLNTNLVSFNELALGFNGSVEMPESGDIITNLDFETSNTSFKTLLSLVPAIYITDFSDLKTSGKLQLKGKVTGAVTETTTPDVEVELIVQDASFSYPDLPKTADDIQIDIAVNYDGTQNDNTVVDINQFHVNMGGNPIDLKLNLRTPISDPFTNGTFKAHLDLSTILDIVPLENTTLKGNIRANLDWMGKLSSIENEQYEQFKADGSITISQLFYNSVDVPKPFEISEANITFSPKYVNIVTFNADLGSSDFSLKGKLTNFIPFALNDETIYGELALNSHVIDLNEFMTSDEAPEEEAEIEETEESAPLEVIEVPKNIDFKFNSNIATLHYDKMDITNLKGVIIVKDGKVVMDELSMNLLDGSMKLSGEYNTQDIKIPLVDFSFDANNLDIQKSFVAFDMLGKIAPIASKATGNISLGMTYSSLLTSGMKPVMKSIAGDGRLSSKQIGVNGGNSLTAIGKALKTDALNKTVFNNVDLGFKIQNGTLQVEPFETSMNGIAMLVNGEQTFENTLDYDFNLKAPRELLGMENPAVNNLYSQAASKGLNIDKSETVDILVKLTGAISNPKVSLDLKKSMSNKTSNIKTAVKENVTTKVEEKKEEVKKDTKEQARKEANKILREAEAKSKAVKAEGKKAADLVRKESNTNATNVVKKAGNNPIAKKAAEVSADKIRDEGDNKADGIEREANKKANGIMKEARTKANRLLQ